MADGGKMKADPKGDTLPGGGKAEAPKPKSHAEIAEELRVAIQAEIDPLRAARELISLEIEQKKTETRKLSAEIVELENRLPPPVLTGKVTRLKVNP